MACIHVQWLGCRLPNYCRLKVSFYLEHLRIGRQFGYTHIWTTYMYKIFTNNRFCTASCRLSEMEKSLAKEMMVEEDENYKQCTYTRGTLKCHLQQLFKEWMLEQEFNIYSEGYPKRERMPLIVMKFNRSSFCLLTLKSTCWVIWS